LLHVFANVFMQISIKLAAYFTTMTKVIEIIQKPRLHLLDVIKDLSIEQLNKIPAGFNNNIIWNLTHMISAQQGICYKRAGLEVPLDERFFMPYQSGAKPEKIVTAEEVEEIKGLFLSTLEQLKVDIQNNLFANYVPWTTRYGVDLNNIDDALTFLPFHEGLHSGYIWALKRVI
jgi:hypothetical protein